MTIPRRAQQRDANEPDIIAAFHRLGWMTQQHSLYDLEVQCPTDIRHHLSIEVKSLKPKGRITPSQAALVASGWDLRFVYEVADVLALVQAHNQAAHRAKR